MPLVSQVALSATAGVSWFGLVKSFYLFILINFYWSIVALQCCVSFYCTAN